MKKTFILCLILLISFFCLADEQQNKDKNRFTLIAVGDIVHPHNWKYASVYKKQGRKMYAATRHIIKQGDLAFANVEGPLTWLKPTVKKAFPFAAPPTDLDDFIWAGFNLFSLSNNHMGDAKVKGVADTLKILKQKQKEQAGHLFWAGAGTNKKAAAQPMIFNVPGKDIKIAFVAYGNYWDKRNKRWSHLVNPFFGRKARRQIKKLKQIKDVDLVMVSLHWGDEFAHVPKPNIVKSYRALINAGADIILAHHPHVPQGIEIYKGKPIFYSLGDYSMGTANFRYKRRGARMYGMIARVDFVKKQGQTKHESIMIYPMYVNNRLDMKVGKKVIKHEPFVARVVKNPFAHKILKSIINWGKQITGNKTRYEIKNERLFVK